MVSSLLVDRVRILKKVVQCARRQLAHGPHAKLPRFGVLIGRTHEDKHSRTFAAQKIRGSSDKLGDVERVLYACHCSRPEDVSLGPSRQRGR